ncbi:MULTISPECIES: AMP-binding protein [Marinobacter]|uniref:AMP-binding protein n=1 Tax=Marinobacter xiaoshiensis TaxID=3073652 RepID=A0ABU2HED4_9GAMM|nr:MULTISPECIES: AMP-binding protein [unclassified Marinobacter]MBK1873570.1 AMP-binding protein [Marinobacter sp. 1-3A]MBK1885210.1 AMP-binding protein [Marinobacter sp. DY40_1A1]MDS1309103.1 AMP-binding protein [Marinobacter sp. F60267]
MAVDPRKLTSLHCLYYWAEKSPERTYLTQPYPDGTVEDINWKQAADQVSRMAAHLNSLELPERSNIAVLGKNSAHWILSDLAIWAAGHVSVPLYPTLNGDAAAYVLEHSKAKLLFLGKLDGTADGWNDIKGHIPSDLPIISLPMSPRDDTPKWIDVIARHEPAAPKLPSQDALATIVYTSGSTGRPKGVMHNFGSMMSVADGLQQMFTVTSEDRMLSYLPLAHVAERAAVETQSLYFGFHTYFADNLDTFQQDLQRARPTLFFSVPRLWMKFYLGVNAKLPPKKQKLLFSIPFVRSVVKKKVLKQLGLDHCRAALTGAAPLSEEIILWYRNLGLELLEVYGMTENFGYSHASRPGRARIGWVGEANPGVEHRIGEGGELEVKSPGMMMGYYQNEEKTREDVTADGFLKTGDMGEIDASGYLKITGRVKDLFKTSKGKYVVPVPIENRFNHPSVEVVCVAGANQPQPCLMILLSEDVREALSNGMDRAELEQELLKELGAVNEECEAHEKISFVVVVKEPWTMENGMLTPTMKIKRNVIEDTYNRKMDSWFEQKRKVVWEL